MRSDMGRNTSSRSFRSTLRSVIGIGAVSALLIGGAAVLAASPASAATATLSFSGVPGTGTAGVALTSFDVNITAGGTATDSITISSTCNLGGTLTEVASSSTATFPNVIINSATSCTLTATDTTSGGTTTSGSITVSSGPEAKIVYTTVPPTKATFSVALTSFSVSVEDASGNVKTSGAGATDTIVISTATAGCALGGTLSEVAAAGVATFTTVDITTGTNCTLTATDSTDGSLPAIVSAAISVATTTPTLVAFTPEPPATAAAGTALTTFAVSVEESNGVVITSGIGATDTVSLTSACKLGGTLSAAALAGVATFSAATIDSAGSCTLIATDSTRALTTATSTPATVVTAGAATQVVFTVKPPASVTTTGTALTSFAVSVEDAFGNVEATGTGATDIVTISSTCTLGGTASASAVAGVATFTALTFTETGSCVLTATDTTRTLTTATATIAVGQPQATLSITTKLGYRDSPLTLATSGGSGTGAVTYSVVNGTATGCLITGNALSATSAGTCIVTAAKAAATPYAPAISAATTVTISSAPKAIRVVGQVWNAQTRTVTITGYNFYGRPTIKSNVAGFSVKVTHDTGKTLTVIVKVTGASKVGVHVMTLTFANGDKTSVKYSLH